jgi:uncharacterized ion transporter superfamily protein YfcC
MIVGVVVLGWWMAELSALFLFATIIVGIVSMKNEPRFVHHFLAGAADMVWHLLTYRVPAMFFLLFPSQGAFIL